MAVVTLFDEILLDPDLFTAGGATGGPEYANTIIKNPSTGIFKTNVNRLDFQQVWTFSTDLLTSTQLDYFMRFWGGGYGSAYGFRCVIVSDFYVIDQVIGTGNGVQTIFPLVKTYLRPGASHSYSRRIIKPVVNALLAGGNPTLFEPNGSTTRAIPTVRGAGLGVPAFGVKKAGVLQGSGYTINNTSGVVTFSVAPTAGQSVTWSGEFDTPARFLQNSFQVKPDVSSDIQGMTICEILPSELAIV
jgi:hypothetical protein